MFMAILIRIHLLWTFNKPQHLTTPPKKKHSEPRFSQDAAMVSYLLRELAYVLASIVPQ
jgi:hypothetical protein